MVFGSFCYKEYHCYHTLQLKSIRITGIQKGFIQSLEIYQSIETKQDLNEVSYLFPTDNKICIYSMQFQVGDEIIPAELRSITQAKEIYDEALKEGKTAVMTEPKASGINSIVIGNVPKGKIVSILFKCSFTSILDNQKTILTKIPLESYDPYGGLIELYNTPSLEIDIDLTISHLSKISDVNVNFNYEYNKIDDYNGKLIGKCSNITDKNIIILTKFEDQIRSQMIQTEKATVISLIPEFEAKKCDNKELIFLIDCSGSMHGNPIQKAKESLSIFISNLSNQSYFNIICFGSGYTKLFDQPKINNKENNENAIEFIEKIDANLGGTQLLSPLTEIFKNDVQMKEQRQIFIVTDGEVEEREKVVNLIKENRFYNRFFAIGLGRGCDSGFLEEIANITNGKYDLILNEDELPTKVKEHYELTKTCPALNTELHIEGNDSFQVLPHPLPPLSPYVLQHIFVTSSSPIGDVIITAKMNNSIDIENVISLKSQLNEKLPIFALFAQLQLKEIVCDEEKSIELSLSSGVLSKYTSYVAVSKDVYFESEDYYNNDEHEIRKAFCLFDDDDTGKINFKNIKRICEELGENLSDEEIQKMVDEYNNDNNNNYTVTEEEFINLMKDYDYVDIENHHDIWNDDSSLSDILKIQNCDGFWDLPSSFIDLKTNGKSINLGIDLSNFSASIINRIKSTIFTIAYLEKFYNDEKSKWENAKINSFKWLSEIDSNAKWDEIVTSNAENILH